MRSSLVILTALWLAACGGPETRPGATAPGRESVQRGQGPTGGAAGPAGSADKLRSTVQVIDVEMEAGAAESTLELEFQTLEAPPTLLQLDVVSDPTRVRFRPDVSRIAAMATLHAGVIAPGRIRLVLGDALSPIPGGRLVSGSLASIPFELLPGPAGSIPVWVESVISSDPTGELEGGPEVFPGPAATISVF
jgi:hypothetical protein